MLIPIAAYLEFFVTIFIAIHQRSRWPKNEPATKFVMLNNRVSFFPFFPKGVRTLPLNTTIFGSI